MKKSTFGLLVTIAVLAVILGALLLVMQQITPDETAPTLSSPSGTTEPSASVTTAPTTVPTTVPTEPETQPTEPTEPPIVKEATATIGATGDILMHDLLIQSGYNSADGSYDYDEIFSFFSAYVSQVDYAVANLEVTLCGNDNGYNYGGYPCFNCPDAIVQALKNAGFDMLLTANNHSYDTRHTGFTRTQQVISDLGLDHIGTRPDTDAPNYRIVDVNGIRIGMINYTYCTDVTSEGKIALNGIYLTKEDSQLVNFFSYGDLDSFYTKLGGEIGEMKAAGAEAIVLYIHWGDEYKTDPNSYQKKMSQALCNLGIDVIVGNHSHVPQPIELLTSETDENQKTLCLYSTGNAVSNIYKTSKFPVTTEDGMLFSFTFAKYSDGTVVVESVNVLPTWVWRYDDDKGVRKFKIMTLDDSIEDWAAHLDISDNVLKKCQDSYARTMDTLGEGLEEANTWYAAHQADVETALGVQ